MNAIIHTLIHYCFPPNVVKSNIVTTKQECWFVVREYTNICISNSRFMVKRIHIRKKIISFQIMPYLCLPDFLYIIIAFNTKRYTTHIYQFNFIRLKHYFPSHSRSRNDYLQWCAHERSTICLNSDFSAHIENMKTLLQTYARHFCADDDGSTELQNLLADNVVWGVRDRKSVV